MELFAQDERLIDGIDALVGNPAEAVGCVTKVAEQREFTQGDESEMTYRTTLPPHVSIDEVTEALVADGTHGLASVSWEPPKKS